MRNKLTIFTATYNREKLLKRLYQSLLRQTNNDFEWIIVDDCSSDNTVKMIQEFEKEALLNMRLICQSKNGGKHRAINRGLEYANGDYFFIVDSDDVLTDNAVELIYKWIESIDGKEKFAGVAGLKAHFNGEICGGKTKIDTSYMDANNFERKKYHLLDDKAEIYKTSVLKRHKFPEFENENFISEAICWDAIAMEGLKLRWFNEVIYLCEYLEDGLTRNGFNKRKGHVDNYQGFSAYVKQSIQGKPIIDAIADFREFDCVSKYKKRNLKQRAYILDISIYRYILILITMPILYCVRIFDRLIYK